jgi:hypothetical protein
LIHSILILQFSQELFSVKNQYFQNSIFRFIDVRAVKQRIQSTCTDVHGGKLVLDGVENVRSYGFFRQKLKAII